MNEPRAARVALGWLVHLYTASGAVLGLLALNAVAEFEPRRALLWMSAATFVDSTDGWMARRLDLEHLIPWIDGRRLDDIVDYFTYVLVPIAFLAHLGLIPRVAWLVALPLIASGLGFANRRAKTEDDYFLGFPSYWNVVALYLWAFGLPAALNGWVLGILSAAVLLPVRFLYPSKTKPLQPLTLALCAVWAVQIVVALVAPDRVPGWWLSASLVFPAYYVGASI